MTVRTSAGSTLGVSASTPATFDVAGYGALTFTTVGEITDFGEFGREYTLVTHNPLADRRTVKRKGSYNDGTLTLQLGQDITDAGQDLLRQGLDSDLSYSFKATYQNGSIRYFSGQIMSFTENVGNVDQIFGGTVAIEIDNDIIFDDPTP